MRVVNETFSHRCALVESLLSKAEARVAELETLYTEKETEVWALAAIVKTHERRVGELGAENALLKEHVADGTDLAMPAWWRGEEHGVKATVQRIETMLTEPDTGGTFGYAPLNRLRERIAALRAVAVAAEKFLDGPAEVVSVGGRRWTILDDARLSVAQTLKKTLAAWRATT
jgi:hypothetical protein